MSSLAFELSVPPVSDLSSGTNVVPVGLGVAESQVHVSPANTDAATSTNFSLAIGADTLLAPEVIVNCTPSFRIAYRKTVAADATVPIRQNDTTGNSWCFSNLAILRCIESIEIVVGGRSIQRRLADLLPFYGVSVPFDRQEDQSLLCTPDTFVNMADYYTGANADGVAPFGKGRSGFYHPRHLPSEEIVDVTSAGAVAAAIPAPWVAAVDARVYTRVRADFSFKLPYEFLSDSGLGLAHLGAVQININWRTSDWARAFTVGIAPVNCEIESITMERFVRNPTLTYTLQRPKEHILEACRGATQLYPCYNYVSTSRTMGISGVTAAQTRHSFAGSAEILGVVPSKLIIALMRDVSTTSGAMTTTSVATTANHWGIIEQLEVRYGGNVLFNSMSESDLLRMSQKNGLQLSALEAGRCGAPIIIDFESDVPLGNLLVGQASSNAVLQVNARVRGTHAGAAEANYQMHIVRVEQGFLSTSANGVSWDLGITLDEAQTRALQQHEGAARARSSKRMLGGSFFSFASRIASRIAKALPAIRQAAPHVLEAIKGISGGSYGPQVTAGCSNALAMPLKPPKKQRGAGIDSGEGSGRLV